MIVHTLLALIIIAIISLYFYFNSKLNPKLKLDINYPKVIVRPFEFTDLDDFETSVMDILNLTISEKWDVDMNYHYGDQMIISKGDLTLLITYDKKEELDYSFKISFRSFKFGKGYTNNTFFKECIISFYNSDVKNKNLTKNINKYSHNFVYNNMVNIREKTKLEVLKKKSKLNDILLPITRDRRIDEILK